MKYIKNPIKFHLGIVVLVLYITLCSPKKDLFSIELYKPSIVIFYLKSLFNSTSNNEKLLKKYLVKSFVDATSKDVFNP